MIAASADRQEGVAAFRAKRKPDFPGNEMLDLTLIPATPEPSGQAFQGRHLIGGHWCDSADGKTVTERCSPSHGVLVSRVGQGRRSRNRGRHRRRPRGL
jgi:hypothetical protein